MRRMSLSQGQFAIIDDNLYDYLSQWKWCFGNGYARRQENRKTIYMHRVVLSTPNNKVTDHINGNKLDNRRRNLRATYQYQNMQNSKLRSNNKSGYKGVHFYKAYKKWDANIYIRGRRLFLGYFDSAEIAALSYNRAAIMYFGEYAKLNRLRG